MMNKQQFVQDHQQNIISAFNDKSETSSVTVSADLHSGEGENSTMSAISKSKKSMLIVSQLSDAQLQEILFAKLDPCPIENMENNLQRQLAESNQKKIHQDSTFADHQNQLQNQVHLEEQSSGDHSRNCCQFFHSYGKDRRRFLLSDECLDRNGLTINSPKSVLVSLFRKILNSDDENSWQNFRYKSRRCTNREHKQTLMQLQLQQSNTTSGATQNGESSPMTYEQIKKIFSQKLDSCTYAHTQIEQDLHPQTFTLQSLPSQNQHNLDEDVENDKLDIIDDFGDDKDSLSLPQEYQDSNRSRLASDQSHASNQGLDNKPEASSGLRRRGGLKSGGLNKGVSSFDLRKDAKLSKNALTSNSKPQHESLAGKKFHTQLEDVTKKLDLKQEKLSSKHYTGTHITSQSDINQQMSMNSTFSQTNINTNISNLNINNIPNESPKMFIPFRTDVSPQIFHLNLKHFKVHPCGNPHPHNPKQCFFYHGQLDRRRNTFYLEELCERGEYCRNKNCQLAHNKAEHLYHPDRYKFKFCSLPFSKCQYGDFCSFAHNEQDIKTPLIHKLIAEQELSQQQQLQQHNGWSQQESQVIATREFYMFTFKTEWCPFTHEHNKAQCVYAHNWQDFRRKPHLFNYNPFELCPAWQAGQFISKYEDGCPLQAYCSRSHGWKEQVFHPLVYKTMPCPDIQMYQMQNTPNHPHCGYHHGQSDKLQPLLTRNKPAQPKAYELHSDVKLLCVNNPNHLKQLLTQHPGGFKGQDLQSLKHLFAQHQVPKEILYHIELRGIVPNKKMQLLRIQNNQLPEFYDTSTQILSPSQMYEPTNSQNVEQDAALLQQSNNSKQILHESQNNDNKHTMMKLRQPVYQAKQNQFSNESYQNQYQANMLQDQMRFAPQRNEFLGLQDIQIQNQSFSEHSHNSQNSSPYQPFSAHQGSRANQVFFMPQKQEAQQEKAADQVLSADIVQSLEKWLDIDEDVPQVQVTWSGPSPTNQPTDQ